MHSDRTLEDWLNAFIQRIHPWFPIKIILFSGYESIDEVELQIGSVNAVLRFTGTQWVLAHESNDLQNRAFIDRIVGILNGKKRDADGNLV